MRVISGQARGHKLKAPEGLSTRPTTDKIKESLFNIMAPDLYECEFLDLFSGSGAIGIEALSRGAQKAIFVDSSEICRNIIEENLKFTRLDAKAVVLKMDIFQAIEKLGACKNSFDIIFLDPPYESGITVPVLKAIVKADLLKADGYIVVERSSKLGLTEVEGLTVFREKDYKTTTMTFLTAGV